MGMAVSSRTSRWRLTRSGMLSQKLRMGDSDAALSLLQRQRALAGIRKNGWSWRLSLANNARRLKRLQRVAAAAFEAERQRLEAQCTVKSAKALAALRARYGAGGFHGDYRDGECRPVAPGGECPVCAWRWGSREPHPIAIPYGQG
jgi:hypothetical protein